MSQAASFTVANAAGAVFRAALNVVIGALATHSSGGTAPSETHPYMFWADTTASRLKMRNGANTAWITLPLSLTSSGTVPDALTVLGALNPRDVLQLGALGAEWCFDGDAGGSGASLIIGPNASGSPDQTYGLRIDRATGKVTLGDGATGGAADHLEVNGGIKAGAHGVTMPDGTLADTAGVVGEFRDPADNSVPFITTSTSWTNGGGWEIQLTPQRSASRFIVFASVVGGCASDAYWRVERDGQPIGLDAGVTGIPALGNLKQPLARVPVSQAAVVYDAPGGAGPYTYRLVFRVRDGSSPLYVHRAHDYASGAYDMTGPSILQVFEIGGV